MKKKFQSPVIRDTSASAERHTAGGQTDLDIKEISKLAQKCFTAQPTIILGSGSSAPFGLPSMDALKTYLVANIAVDSAAETDAWTLVRTALASGDHLEASLEGKNLPQSLLSKIVQATWNCVNEKDRDLFQSLSQNPNPLPLGQVLKGLFRSSNREVDIVTTNYDRVVEYSCNSVGVLFHTGFTPGYLQSWAGDSSFHFMQGTKKTRTARIWKVHGSLDWFQIQDGQTIGMPIFSEPSANQTPQIVTPGLNKYQKTHEDPFRSTMNGADRALKAASAFLCVGYGFRDEHIHPKINQRCREENIPTVVLARTLTDEAKAFLRGRAGSNYLGIEMAGAGSKAYSSSHPDGIEIPKPNLWSLDCFYQLVT